MRYIFFTCFCLIIYSWDPNPLVRHSIWSIVFGGAGAWLALFAVNQAQVQRALSTVTLKQAQM